MNAEQEAVIKEIRCLIITCKNGLYLKRLWKEYKDTTGEYIPFRKFGFDSVEQFLRSTNQFIWTSCGGDFVLMAKPTEKSGHISKLVQCQNDTKKKRSQPPKFIRPYNNYNSGSQQRNNYGSSSSTYGNRSTRYQPSKPAYQNSSYSNMSAANNNKNNSNNNYSYQSSASASAKPSKPFANTTNTNKNSNNVNYSNSNSQPAGGQASVPSPPANVKTPDPVHQDHSYDRQTTNPFLNDGWHKISITNKTDASSSPSHQPVQRQPIIEENQRENNMNEKNKRMAEAIGISPAHSERSFGNNQSNNKNMHSIVQREQALRMAEENERRKMAEAGQTIPVCGNTFTTPIPASIRTSSRMSRKESLKQTMLNEQLSKLGLDTKSKVNIHSRLQLPKKSTDSLDTTPVPSPRRIEPKPEPEIEIFDFSELDAFDSAVEAITFYCAKKKWPEPTYKFVQLTKQKFICSVEVNNIRYACYPNEYETQNEAQKATADIALLEIKELEESKKYPVCKDSPHDIAQQINACIGENGVFLDSLQTVFQSTYQQSLPKEWRLFIQNNADLFTLEMNSLGKAIVYPKRPKLVNAHTTHFKLRPIQIDQIKTKRFPWGKKEWNIFISTIKSIDDVRGFLYAEDDKDNLTGMIDSYELKLMTGEKKEVIASNIRIGGYYYTTYIENNRTRVMRIQVIDVDHSRRKAQCYFIDLGEDELVSFDRIYVMASSMLEVPAQAIRFSLADLDVFDDEEIEREAINLLFNNHVLAEIKTTEDEYLCGGNDPMIKTIFHLKPIGSNNKINLNLKIAMSASKYFDPIELEDDRLVNAVITHVNESGIIHCHLCEENSISHICQLINKLTAKGIDSKYRAKNLSTEDVYLIYDEYEETWFRGMLLSLEPTDDLLFKFIDYGMVARINIQNVYQLKELSGILNAFPPQTVNVRLHNDGSKSKEFIKCLQGHLQKGDVVTMDVIEKTVIPSVKIWKRIDGSGIIDIYKLCLIETNDDDTSSMSSANRNFIQRIQRKYVNNA